MTRNAEALKVWLRIGAALLLALGCDVQAAPAATPRPDSFGQSLGKVPSTEDLKPSGPIDITADKLESVVGATAVYTGNVKLTSNTLKLDGDRLELKQVGPRQYEAHLTGNPGHLTHTGTGAENPPIDARAKTLNYDMRSGTVDLIGDAYVKKCDDTATAETIRYNVLTRSIDATRGSGDQVHITLQPQETAPASGGCRSSAASAAAK